MQLGKLKMVSARSQTCILTCRHTRFDDRPQRRDARRPATTENPTVRQGDPSASPDEAAGRVRRSSRSHPKDYPRTQAGPGAQGDRSRFRPAGRGADHGGYHRRLNRVQSPGADGRRQLYGDELNIPLMNFLARAGAEADPVAPYASNVDDERVADQIERIGAGARKRHHIRSQMLY